MARVSIVIPAYNAEAFLEDTIRSVQAQTLADWELVVVDDGSSDGTHALACSLAAAEPRMRVIRQANGGIARARNAGLAALAPGTEFVIFLDNDDLWEPEALELLSAALDAHAECVSAYGNARSVDRQGEPIPGDTLEANLRRRRGVRDGHVVDWSAGAHTDFSVLAVNNCILTPGLHLARRRAVEQIGGFDPSTVPCDDWDYSLRLSRLGEIAFVDRVILRWRRHGSNASDTSRTWRHAYFTVRDRLLASPDNTPEQRQQARIAYAALCRSLTAEGLRALRRRRFGRASRHLRRGLYAWLRMRRCLLLSS